jgi:MscS family membrane protein
MPNTTETNTSLEVLTTLDSEVNSTLQSLLSPLYESSYGYLLSGSFLGVPIAQLLLATFIFLLFLVLRNIFTYVVLEKLKKLTSVTPIEYDTLIIDALKPPLRFTFLIIGVHLFFLLSFGEPLFIKRLLNTLLVFNLFWAIWVVIDALRGLIYTIMSRVSKDLSQEIGNFFIAIVKVLVGAIGLGAMLQLWGINVTALIASLGIGGLAFALAAKDMVANLFASFSLLADKSIRIGEWIKVNGIEGTVEDIGMRTTKIRSFEHALITVPNHLLANNPLENFSRRGTRRIKLEVGLSYESSATQIENIVTAIKEMLQNHQEISKEDTLLVNFESFGSSTLNIFVYTFTNTSNWKEYLRIRQEVHFNILQIVEEHNVSLAFPTQSLYIESTPDKSVV